MSSKHRFLRSSAVSIAASVLTLAISATVLLAWFVRFPRLVQFNTEWLRVQPNTALALLVVSIAMLLAERQFKRLAASCGLAAATLSALVLAQDVFRIDLGIDALLARAWPSDYNAAAGRMAPNAAIGIVLVSTAVCLMKTRLHAAVAVCSIGAWALGSGALLGYATGLEATYQWGRLTPLAPATALSLLMLSSALLWDRSRAIRHQLRGGWHGPLVAGLGSVVLTFLFFQALLVAQQRQIEATVTATTQRIATEIRVAIQAQRDALSGLAREWDDTFFKRRGAWESDARIVFARSQGLHLIAWYEAAGELNWSYPPDVDIPNIDLSEPIAVPEATRSSIDAVALNDGSTGFALITPLMDSGVVDGWLCGLFRSSDFFGGLSTTLPEGYNIRLESAHTIIYDSGNSERVSRQWWRSIALVPTSNLILTAHPTASWLSAHSSHLPWVILGAGLLVSGLLVWALRAAQLSADRAGALEVVLEAHQQTANEVRLLNLQLEERVSQRTAELQRTNHELRDFASFLSHELRQPVNAQALWAELLGTQYAAALDEQGRDYVAKIGQSAKRIGYLIDAQLSLSKIDSIRPQLESVDLNATVDEVISDLAPSIDDSRAAIKQEKLPVVMGNAAQLYQLFRNLIENSIRYRRPDVPIEVSISSQLDTSGIEIIYSDNGQGFESADQEMIFSAFARANDSSSEGLGLGLAICRRIMECCGGSIRAQSRAGRGATFLIRFPSAPQGAPGALAE